MKNILDKTPKTLQKGLHAKLRGIFEAPEAKTARILLNQVLDECRDKAPKAMEILKENLNMQ